MHIHAFHSFHLFLLIPKTFSASWPTAIPLPYHPAVPSYPITSTPNQFCNLYSELCSRKFSNITTVVAHNSPFTRPHNALSNQDQPVITQLNDGIRGLEFATHLFLDELHLCHSDCLLLNAGPLEAYLRTVARWLLTHPDEVLTLILTNDDRVPPTAYTAPFNHSGLLPYIYVPHKPTMDLSDWPTLSEMIRRNQRVVVTLDYGANTTEVPWLLDEWSIRWQTPFSPADPSFPCTVHRPPSQPSSISRNRMYMANHNLNIPIFNFRAPLSASLTKHMATDSSILVPAYSLFEQVNAVDGNMSLGQAVQGCEKMWGRPPNGLLVDYYEAGGGSVFEVAAKANGLVYKKSCCGGGLRKAMMMEGGRYMRFKSAAGTVGIPEEGLFWLGMLAFVSVIISPRGWG